MVKFSLTIWREVHGDPIFSASLLLLEIAQIMAISTWDPFLLESSVSLLIVGAQEQFNTLQKALLNSTAVCFMTSFCILKYGGKLRRKFCANYLACILHKIFLTTCSLVNQVLKFLFRVHWNWVKTFHRQLEALQSTNSNCQVNTLRGAVWASWCLK